MELRLPAPCLVVLVGASSSGKSTWAAHDVSRDSEIVSSDRLRGIVGAGEDDQQAGTAAFSILEQIVDRANAPPADDGGRHPRLRPGQSTEMGGSGPRGRAPRLRRRVRHPAGRPGIRNTERPAPSPSRCSTSSSAGFGSSGPRSTTMASTASWSNSPSPWWPPRSPSPRRGEPRTDRPRPGHRFGLGDQPIRLGRGSLPDGAASCLHRLAGRGGRIRRPVGDGPLPSDPPGRPPMGGHSRGLHRACLPGRGHQQDQAGSARDRDRAPPSGGPGEDGGHPGCPLRGQGQPRSWHRMGSGGARGLWDPLPTGAGSLRTTGGHPPHAPSPLGQGLSIFLRHDVLSIRVDLLPPTHPGPDPDPHRRVRRETDAAAGRQICRCLQSLRPSRCHPPQGRSASPALRGYRAGP